MGKLTIGTRGSALALWQSNWVAGELARLHTGTETQLLTIKTRGDKILDVSLAKVGGKGLFVTEIENALLSGEADLAVHSLKDVPTEQPEGLCLAAFPERGDPMDALVSREGLPLRGLPQGATIGTSSLRRVAQLKHARPDLQFAPLRGNVDTRLRKLAEGEADAIILAAAGLKRLGRQDAITERLSPEVCLPAAGQGIVCIECRSDDDRTRTLLAALDSPASRVSAAAERHVIAALEGSCQVPIGAFSEIEGDALTVRAVVADLEGKRLVRAEATGRVTAPEEAAEAAVARLKEQGAEEILAGVLASEG